MKILFCTTAVPEAMEFQIKEISAAGNRFQMNMIQSMKAAGYSFSLLSYVGVPVSREVCEATKEDGICGERASVVYKQKSLFQTIREYRREMKRLAEAADVLLCYNVVHVWMNLPRLAEKNKKKSVLILADYSGPESYRNPVRKLYAWLSLKVMRKFDVVAGLSANIEKKLKRGQEFLLMEGGIDASLYHYFGKKEPASNQVLTLMYSGLLSSVTGVDRLLSAMACMPDAKLSLVITGKGPLEDAVKAAAKADSRIRFLGHLQYGEYLEYLSRADVLVNPRNMTLPENQNNFPSKIFDYLAAGKFILSTRFIGWEKFRNVICFCEDTPESLAEEICRMAPKKEAESGWAADSEKQFEAARRLAETFLWEKQVKRLLE